MPKKNRRTYELELKRKINQQPEITNPLPSTDEAMKKADLEVERTEKSEEEMVAQFRKNAEEFIAKNRHYPTENNEEEPGEEVEKTKTSLEDTRDKQKQSPAEKTKDTTQAAKKQAVKEGEKKAVEQGKQKLLQQLAKAPGWVGWVARGLLYLEPIIEGLGIVLLSFTLIMTFAILLIAQSGCAGKQTPNNPDYTNQEDMNKLKLLKALSDINTGKQKYILSNSNIILTVLEDSKTNNTIPDNAKTTVDEIINQLNIIINAGAKGQNAEKAADEIVKLADQLIDKLNDPAFGKIGNYGEIFNTEGYAKPVERGEPKGYAADDGLDIIAPVGTNVMAIADGTIAYIDTTGAHIAGYWGSAYGGGVSSPNHLGSIGLNLKDGNYVFYTYLSMIDFNLTQGSEVKKGQVIAKSGRANDTEHLHISLAPYRASGKEWLRIVWSYDKIKSLWWK